MPRTARNVVDGFFYHVLNRGNRKQKVFHKDLDYRAFIELMEKAKEKVPMRIYAYCLMPNHYHFLLSPQKAEYLSQWMHWLKTVHASRYHHHYETCGHIWQSRFKNIPVQDDEHLISILRYVEGNPVRSSLVRSAQEWPWSSHLYSLGKNSSLLLDAPPLQFPSDWGEFVNHTMQARDLGELREAVAHNLPFGDKDWKREISAKYGIKSYKKKPGRPKKQIG